MEGESTGGLGCGRISTKVSRGGAGYPSEAMKLDSADRTLRQVLNTYFFFIPRFQRPYSWELENVEELWEDAIQESADDYFIGSMVVYPHRDDTVAVIDGQQRLTTLMMLLCAIPRRRRRAGPRGPG